MSKMLDSLTVPGHVFSIPRAGWGEPLTYYPSCSCGWVGLIVHEKWFTDEERSFDYFVEPWRTIAQTYGPDHTLNGSSVFGEEATGVKQILIHVKYNPNEDVQNAHSAYAKTLQEALRAPVEETGHMGSLIAARAEEVKFALARAQVWEDCEVPAVVQQHPEAKRLLAQTRNARTEADLAATTAGEAETQELIDSVEA